MAKNQKKTNYGRRRGFRLLYKILSAIIIIAAVIGGSILFFRVNDVQVIGSTKYSKEQILATAGVEEQSNLLLLPKKQIAERITSSYPYVDAVVIKLVLPSTVKLEIRECQPLAAVQADGAWWILDARGKILERTEESIAKDYIQVTGLTLVKPQVGLSGEVDALSAPMFQALKGILTALEKVGIAKNANWIDISARTEVDMGYLGRYTVRLPVNMDYGDKKKNNAEYFRKIEILAGMIPQLDEADRGTIDLRGQDGHYIPK